MRYLHARLDQPDWMRHPMQEFLAGSRSMDGEELVAWNLSREDVQFLLFHVEGDIDAYRDRLEALEHLRWYELTPVDDGSFLSYVCEEYTESDTEFFSAFAELNLVVVPPIAYDEGGDPVVTVVGRSGELTDLVDALQEGAEVGVDVLDVGTYDRRHAPVTGALTDRQFEALETATRLGYYAAPREASLAAVADELGVADGTASELLRTAESRLMERVVGSVERSFG